MEISDRRTNAKTITSSDNAFVTNIVAATVAAAPKSAHRTPSGSFALCESEATAANVFCSEAKRQLQMFYLRESVAAAANVFCSESKAAAANVFCSESKAAAANVFCSESKATATNVLSVRKRSDSYKAPSRSGNQPHVMMMSLK